MSFVTHSGIHPSFRMDLFAVDEQRVLRRFAELFHLTSDGEIFAGHSSKYRYALMKPSNRVSGIVHSERELMLVFSDYQEFQPRTIDAFDRILAEASDEFRIEKVVRILVSLDSGVSTKVKSLFRSKPEAPVVVPFYFEEIRASTSDSAIFERIREFTFARDLFSVSSPLRGDLYFYGRSNLIHEIVAKLASGENFGLFGLRRSGKTSIVNGIDRTLQSRDVASIIIDCQTPGVHQRRWNMLLFFIAQQMKSRYSINVNLRKEGAYSELDAAESFLADMKVIRGRLKVEKIALLFDEIERISFPTASSPHWNEERDFLLFWQSIRFGFQSSDSPFTFLLVGTNPSAIEKTRIFESDNPLFGNVEKRFIPMFGADVVTEMINDLGGIMGISFENGCANRLVDDYGGHPFLTRHACSYLAKVRKDRPITIDRTIYQIGRANFSQDAESYVDSVVELLKVQYPDEYELLKYLAHGDHDSFSYYALEDPRMIQHLIGYGIVAKGEAGYFFKVGVIQKYFENIGRSAKLVSEEARRTEIGERRNGIELLLRRKVKMVFSVAFHPNERKTKLLEKINVARRTALDAYDYEGLLAEGASPLYFLEVCQLISGYWDQFGNTIGISAQEFSYHYQVVNSARYDAHAKSVSDINYDKVRVSLAELELRLKE